MLGKLCFLSLAIPALTSPIVNGTIASRVKRTPSLENITGNTPLVNITGNTDPEMNEQFFTTSPPLFENVTGIPPLENMTGNPKPEKMGCTFDDKLLVSRSSNESGNDYSAFQESSAFYWNDNQVPYFFNSNIQENDKELIKEAMETMEQNTCITFVEGQENAMPEHHLEVFIEYQPNDCIMGNSAFVMNQGVATKLTMSFERSFECGGQKNLILHELGHVLGLAHTHKRPDRDQFIQVNYDCIEQGQKSQFELLNENDVDTFGVPYKCNSMMHYNNRIFSKGNGCPTISAQPGQCEEGIGGDAPIPEDWEIINKAYTCPM